tara:strand:+ start:719 stop:895 length:177 start_codon:yes stop_codon:yes gene_type:complete
MTKYSTGGIVSKALMHQKMAMQATDVISIDVLKLTGGSIQKSSIKCCRKKVGTRNGLK